ncbi:MAG: tagaturonate epimerase family protein [Bacteroidota bacterium]|nr:tagaturonate epimerase family protein [Bacteroidota bacterium]
MKLEKYSFGIGDRFSHEGEAQLGAIIKAKNELGIDISPVWNKSNREHTIVHSEPADTRVEADNAVKALGFKGSYFVDADHINLSNVDKFIDSSNFFTLDVADYIGKAASDTEIEKFVVAHKSFVGSLTIPGIQHPFTITEEYIRKFAAKFLFATTEASKIYQHIASKKGVGNFITEVSMDEVDEPQSPLDMLFILKSLADLKVPAQTIAPKFTGRFNKGVDYVGDVQQFEKEFEEDMLVIDYAVKNFHLPEELKLSVHSGSDKFSIYPIMGKLIKKYNKGIHVKTAGTTWLEEVIGLSLAGEDALDLAKAIYSMAYRRQPELCGPYATVIDIKADLLPTPESITKWTSEEFAQTLQHEQSNPRYNPSFRQLIHVGYKVASEYGVEYTDALKANKEIVGKCVADNIYERHIKRLFVLE